jgi:hypothetical protein
MERHGAAVAAARMRIKERNIYRQQNKRQGRAEASGETTAK